ncbi:hypothetical protein O181_118865 [Austropuccinia psidii MF-1]|uniref:Uncharacterized protein n=1 Tax=Austropuccinia psidii MF-1 TaxID=1389203 RepID=A0A9Q3KCZ7_9BASI|nr:hypothetical protein [Austropuccinia psidii MF-1]
MQYTFVNVCCREEQKLFKNVTCNHVKPSSHISQLHPFGAPCWTALPNYGTDACVIQVNPHAFIRTPQPVIRRQLSHTWKTFYSQYSDRLFYWLAGQLDCRRSPARTWKPEANQCGFASASSALQLSQPMISEAGYVCMGISHHRSFSASSHAPRTCSQKIPWAGSLFRGRVNAYVDHSSRPPPPLIMPHIPPWKPSRHQSAKNFRQNQAHVWWHTTKHISPAHTQTSPQ